MLRNYHVDFTKIRISAKVIYKSATSWVRHRICLGKLGSDIEKKLGLTDRNKIKINCYVLSRDKNRKTLFVDQLTPTFISR